MIASERMNIGFLVTRKGYLKVLGSVIQAAVDHRHRVTLLWDPLETKPGELIDPAEDLAAWPRAIVRQWNRGTPLLPALQAAGVEALVGTRLFYVLKAYGYEAEMAALAPAGIRVFNVDYIYDTITLDPDAYRYVDTTFYLSELQREVHWRVKAKEFAELGGDAATWRRRSAVCGSTMTDQLARVDRAEVRRRYGIAAGRPVVVFTSLKMVVPDPWRRAVWGAEPRLKRIARALRAGHLEWIPTILRTHGYRTLVQSVRRFCQRTGAALVVKSREKNDDPLFLRDLADVSLGDERVYPYTSMELMGIASLCIHFQSGASLEAAFAGVPSLSIVVPQPHLVAYPTFDEVYSARPGTMQNFPGIVWSLPAEAVAAKLDASRLEDFRIDPAARSRYVEKFLGFDDTRSSERVLDEIERVSAAAPAVARSR